MLGFFVHHTSLKLGKVCSAGSPTISVLFYSDNSRRSFERSAFSEKELLRTYLPLGTQCRLGHGHCRVEGYEGEIELQRPATYRVITDEDLVRLVSEVDLEPVGMIREDPVSSLAGLHADGYALFQARARLLGTYRDMVRHAGGLQALLSSRIDVRSHQAYVAGVVLQDRVRRYILADEVGLGKTVEAGVIVQHLLSTQADARVLVLCPGALTQQWLCEFFGKFGNRVFTLLELYQSAAALPPERRKTVVAPLEAVSGEHREWLLQTRWDLVVVDEVHHLLASPDHYAFVRAVSSRAPGLLLLSALPAQQRKAEFLRLLALLEPERYGDAPPEDFDRLFDSQADIGRQLRRFRRRLEEEHADPEEIREVAADLVGIPALADDAMLQARYRAVAGDVGVSVEAGWRLLREAASRGRVNRRILRNRRARLVEERLLERTERKLLLRPYEPGQPELDAVESVTRLVRSLVGRVPDEAWLATARVFMQSLAHPETALEILSRLIRVVPSATPRLQTLGYLAGAGGWEAYRDSLLSAARPHLSRTVIEDAIEATRTWRDAASGLERVTFLADELERLERAHKKIVLFAGFPGLIDHLEPYLVEQFEQESLAVFRAEMGREEKEKNVDRFRTDSDAWLLLCDESGGEGRNFQFASAVVHFDNPWYVSRVEQRIGRLDRLGRGVADVPSCVLVGLGTPEHDLVRCFAEGFGVYTNSVSGLEFALREMEAEVVRTLVGGAETTGVDDYVPLLRERAAGERSREEAEAVLDEASFNRDAAARYRRGDDLTAAEEDLEPAFIDFLRKAGSGNAVRQSADREFPDGVWDLDPTQLQHITTGVKSSEKPAPTRYRGTFRRAVAQVRHELEFFSVGHPFFDGVIASAGTQPCGRVYAVDVDAEEDPVWLGFEFVLTVGPEEPLSDWAGVCGRAGRLFSVAPVHVFVDGGGRLAMNAERLLALRQAITGTGKDRTWWNLTKEKAVRALAAFPGSKWGQVVTLASTVATAEARRQFAERLGSAVAVEVAHIAEERQASRDPQEGAALQALLQSISNWTVRIDAAGFLSVNGGLGRSR